MKKTRPSRGKSRPPESPAALTLHDGLCQTLTGIHLFAGVLTRRVRKTAPRLAREMDELHALIERARTECHLLLATLRGPARKKSARKPRPQVASAR